MIANLLDISIHHEKLVDIKTFGEILQKTGETVTELSIFIKKVNKKQVSIFLSLILILTVFSLWFFYFKVEKDLRPLQMTLYKLNWMHSFEELLPNR